MGGNLSPGRSLDTTWDEAKRKANSSSELIPLQCCLPSHREFPLQPRSHRHSTVFIFPAAVCHSPASLQWSWSQQTTRLKGKRLDSPAGLASRRSEAAAPGAHGPSLQAELRLAGQPQQLGWSWPRLAGHRRGPRTSGSNCARKSRLSHRSRRQGRRKKGPLPCQEGESCCSLHKQWLPVLSSAPQHRLGPGGDRSAGCSHPLLCRTGPSSSPGAALIHGICSWASSPTVFGLCAVISSFQNDKTPHSHPQLPAHSHPVPQPSTSYTPAPSSRAARCQAALNPGKRGEVPGPLVCNVQRAMEAVVRAPNTAPPQSWRRMRSPPG